MQGYDDIKIIKKIKCFSIFKFEIIANLICIKNDLIFAGIKSSLNDFKVKCQRHLCQV